MQAHDNECTFPIPLQASDPVSDLRRFERLHDRMFGTHRAKVRIGRYELGDQLGRGGSGFVHRGYDPTLRRTIAIKIIPVPHQIAAKKIDILMAEAHALARIDHPHLVRVYDAGTCTLLDTTHSTQLPVAVDNPRLLYMVMELVEGPVLRDWLANGRSPAEILSAFLAMGNALAAAHASGIVHRDFKPANIAFDSEGQPKILDFGLAGAATPCADFHENPPALGTPAYMAPEQHEGQAGDPLVDQFAFCLTLWEALTGARPYPGPTLEAYRTQKLAANLVIPGKERSKAILRVLSRGLNPDPAQRWSDMSALVDALRRAQWRRHAFRVLAGGMVVLVGIGAGSVGIAANAAKDLCDDTDQQAEEIWNLEVQDRLATQLARRVPTRAKDTTDVIQRRFERLTHSWAQAHAQACTLPTPERDEVVQCLEGAKVAAQGVRQALEHSPGTESIRVLDLLPEPTDCIREHANEPHWRAAYGRELMEYRSRFALGDLEVVLRHAEFVLDLDDSLPPAVRAEWSLVRGLCLTGLHRLPEAREALEEAWMIGVQAHNLHAGVRALLGLSSSMFATNPEQARTYLELADSHRESLGPRGQISLDGTWAQYHLRVDRDLDAALARWRAVVEQLVELNSSPLLITTSAKSVASVLIQMGRFEEADNLLNRMLDHVDPEIDGQPTEASLMVQRGFSTWLRGDIGGAARDFAFATSRVWVAGTPFALEIYARVSADQGHPEDAEAEIAAFRDQLELRPNQADPTTIAQATVDLYRGRFSAAAVLPDPAEYPGLDWELELLGASAAAVAGRIEEVRRAISVVDAKAHKHTEHTARLLYLDTAELATLVGDFDLCMRLLESVVDGPSPQLRARAYLVSARAALIAGRDELVDEFLRRARHQLAELEGPWTLAEVELDLLSAVRRARQGEQVAAQILATQAMSRRGSRHSLALARAASLLIAPSNQELAQLAHTWVRELGDELGADPEVIEWLARPRPSPREQP
ncbi:MAG: serine/threonine-protein kinase [Myxococcota bacterium]